MANDRITLFGAGRMGSALAGGWLSAKDPVSLDIVDPSPAGRVTEWVQQGLVRHNPGAQAADVLVLAVKPQVFSELAPEIMKWIGAETRVLSIMAGVSIETLQRRLGTMSVFRAMPNTPGLVGKGVTILCAPENADERALIEIRTLLDPLGEVEGPISEDVLSAATAVSGCGPAYAFLLAEVMAAAGVANGLAPDLAARLARKTVEGAGALMESSPEDASTLRKNVTSPNGVTQAALEVLMSDSAMPRVFNDAIAAAIARDQALVKETE